MIVIGHIFAGIELHGEHDILGKVKHDTRFDSISIEHFTVITEDLCPGDILTFDRLLTGDRNILHLAAED